MLLLLPHPLCAPAVCALQWVCWFISVQWELIELCLKHWLPNFAECWWDSWVLDVLLSNGLGIYLGHVVCQRLEMRAYRWTRLQDIPTLLGKVRRAALQFTPGSWMVVRWESTSTISRFLTVNVVICALNLAELNAFLLKALLWIPPPNPLNVLRLLIWAGLGPSAIRQVYIYTHSPHVRSVGLYTFLSCCILSTELLLILKLSKGEFTAETPSAVRIGVGLGLVVYAAVVAVVCLRIGRRAGSSGGSNSGSPVKAVDGANGTSERLKGS
jgi:phosphatidylserine synthase 2